jgi:hypothetical protein
MPVHISLPIGHKSAFHNDILMSERSPELAALVIDAIRNHLGRTSFAHFRYLVDSSVFTQQLIKMGLAWPQCTSVSILENETITDQYSRLGGKRRKVLRSNERRMREQYKVEVVYHTGATITEAFDELMRLHYKRREALKSQSLLSGPSYDFLRDVTLQLGALNQAEIVILQADGSPIAAELYLHDGDNYYGLHSGFDIEFARFSPIRILGANVLQRGFDEGRFRNYDLGPAFEQHKFDWNPQINLRYFACLSGKSISSRAICASYRRAFRISLPKALIGRDRVSLDDLVAVIDAQRT